LYHICKQNDIPCFAAALLDIETINSVKMNKDVANDVDDNAGYCTVGADDYIVVSSPEEEINLRVDTLQDLCEATRQGGKIVYAAIDAEWVTDLITVGNTQKSC
jgi:hypothetical protein